MVEGALVAPDHTSSSHQAPGSPETDAPWPSLRPGGCVVHPLGKIHARGSCWALQVNFGCLGKDWWGLGDPEHVLEGERVGSRRTSPLDLTP